MCVFVEVVCLGIVHGVRLCVTQFDISGRWGIGTQYGVIRQKPYSSSKMYERECYRATRLLSLLSLLLSRLNSSSSNPPTFSSVATLFDLIRIAHTYDYFIVTTAIKVFFYSLWMEISFVLFGAFTTLTLLFVPFYIYGTTASMCLLFCCCCLTHSGNGNLFLSPFGEHHNTLYRKIKL